MYPKGDSILSLCNELKAELREELQPGDIGTFIKNWADLEDYVMETARRTTQRNVSLREAFLALARQREFKEEQATQLDALRRFRNMVVHQPSAVKLADIRQWSDYLRDLLKDIRKGGA